jgi:hypothetical protein
MSRARKTALAALQESRQRFVKLTALADAADAQS